MDENLDQAENIFYYYPLNCLRKSIDPVRFTRCIEPILSRVKEILVMSGVTPRFKSDFLFEYSDNKLFDAAFLRLF